MQGSCSLRRVECSDSVPLVVVKLEPCLRIAECRHRGPPSTRGKQSRARHSERLRVIAWTRRFRPFRESGVGFGLPGAQPPSRELRRKDNLKNLFFVLATLYDGDPELAGESR